MENNIEFVANISRELSEFKYISDSTEFCLNYQSSCSSDF